MENSAIQSQGPFLTTYFPPLPDSAKRIVTYSAASILTGRLSTVSLSISAFNAFIVSVSAHLSKDEANLLKKLIVTVISLAASTLFMTTVGLSLLGRVGHVMTRDALIKLACFHACGEGVLFAIPYLLKLNGPKLPESKEEVEKLTEPQLLFICRYFEDYKRMPAEIFALLIHKLRILDHKHIFPSPFKSLEDIQKLNAFEVRYAYSHYDEMTTEMKLQPLYEALHRQFYEQDLPLPKGLTVQKVLQESKDYLGCELNMLPTLKQITTFSKNKIAWLICHLAYSKDFASYPINDQFEINKIFLKECNCSLAYRPTIANIVEILDENIQSLYTHYNSEAKIDQFICLPQLVKTALNDKFENHPKCQRILNTDFKMPKASKISKLKATIAYTWHQYFTNNPEKWKQAKAEQKKAFNTLFKNRGLKEID